ncbi:MAG: dethiobiotin synthase [Burkholderiales bacterium]
MVEPRDPPQAAGRRSLFVVGTDTGVGKTRIACLLLRAFAGRGERVTGMKPVAAGVEPGVSGKHNLDVELLRAASNIDAPLQLVNPYCFADPIAPHLAAAAEGVVISLDVIRDAFDALQPLANRVVVEGAGGFLVPLGPDHDMGDLAQRLAVPLVMVVGMRLGCLNHALLTAESITRRGLHLAGWVANCIDPEMHQLERNISTLQQRLTAPLVGIVPNDSRETGASGRLDIERLESIW